MTKNKNKRINRPPVEVLHLEDFGRLRPEAVSPGHTSGGTFRKEDLGLILFKSGFKNVNHASALIGALASIIEDRQFYAMDKPDRLELFFTYLLTDHCECHNRASHTYHETLWHYLNKTLLFLSSPFKLECFVNDQAKAHWLKLTLIKVPILVMISPEDTPAVTRPGGLDELVISPSQSSITAKIDEVFMELSKKHAVRNECICLDSFWNYYRSFIRISAFSYSVGDIGYDLIAKYEKQVYDLYRFIMFYHSNGGVDCSIFRRVELDSSSV